MKVTVESAFDELLQTAGGVDASLTRVLKSPAVLADDLIALTRKIRPFVLPKDVVELYRLCGFSRVNQSSERPPFIGGFTFVPFSWLLEGFSSNIEVWRYEDSLYLPLFADGSGSEICFECSPSTGLWRRDLDEPEPILCFDSITSCLLSYAGCVRNRACGVVSVDKLKERHRIFRELNPSAVEAWPL